MSICYQRLFVRPICFSKERVQRQADEALGNVLAVGWEGLWSPPSSQPGQDTHMFSIRALSSVCWKQASFLVNTAVIHANCFFFFLPGMGSLIHSGSTLHSSHVFSLSGCLKRCGLNVLQWWRCVRPWIQIQSPARVCTIMYMYVYMCAYYM